MHILKAWFLLFFVNLLFVLVLTIILSFFPISLGLAGFAVIYGFSAAFFSLFISKWLVKRWHRMRQIVNPSNAQEALLLEITAETARRGGVPMPELWIYSDQRPNAFATGPSRNNAMIALSTGLLQMMDSTSLRGVIGHEMGHIANGDMLSTTLLVGLMNSYVIWLGNTIGRWLGNNILTQIIITIGAEMVLSFLALIPISAFSRHREYSADAFSAKIWGPEPMTKALQELSSADIKVNIRKEALATAYIHGNRTGLFATHPHIQDRIARLTKNFPPQPVTYCSNCGQALRSRGSFCGACGAKLSNNG